MAVEDPDGITPYERGFIDAALHVWGITDPTEEDVRKAIALLIRAQMAVRLS
jgi:hypothetical protein